MSNENMETQRKEILKMAKEERNKAYYQRVRTNKTPCEACCTQVLTSYWKQHIETARHRKFEAIKKKLDEAKEKEKAPKPKRGRPCKSN